MKAKMNWNQKVLALCLVITLLFASSLDVYAASATMTSYGSNVQIPLTGSMVQILWESSRVYTGT